MAHETFVEWSARTDRRNRHAPLLPATLVLVVGGMSEWKIPLALSHSVLSSAYVVDVQVMYHRRRSPSPSWWPGA